MTQGELLREFNRIDSNIGKIKDYKLLKADEKSVLAIGLKGITPIKIEYKDKELYFGEMETKEYERLSQKVRIKKSEKDIYEWERKIETIMALEEIIKINE